MQYRGKPKCAVVKWTTTRPSLPLPYIPLHTTTTALYLSFPNETSPHGAAAAELRSPKVYQEMESLHPPPQNLPPLLYTLSPLLPTDVATS